MGVPRIISTSSAIDITRAADTLVVPTHGARRGDTLIVMTAAYGPDPLTFGGAFPDPQWAIDGDDSTATLGNYGIRRAWWGGEVTAESLESVTISRAPGIGSSTWYAMSVVVRGGLSVIDNPGIGNWFDDYNHNRDGGSWDLTDHGMEMPAVEAVGDDRLVVMLSATSAINSGFTDILPIPGWEKYSTSRSPLALGMVSFDLHSREQDTGDTPFAWITPVDVAVGADWIIDGLNIAIMPGPDPDVPPLIPAPVNLRLDCAESYTAWITDRSYENRLESIPWSSINWERVLDAPSDASVDSPDELGGAYCLARLGPLVPWKYGLILERNDQEVWKGPINSVKRPVNQSGRAVDYVRIGAVDILGRYAKLPLIYGAPAHYKSTDTGVIFREIINIHSRSSADLWEIPVPEFSSGTELSRVLRASDNQAALDVLQDLMDSSIDAFISAGVLYCFDPSRGWVYFNGLFTDVLDGPYSSTRDFVYGTFTSESYSERPGWGISGNSQGNYVTVASTQVGEMGFAKIYQAQDATSQDEYGVLLLRDQNQLSRPQDGELTISETSLQRRADSLRDLHSIAPAVVDGGVLAEGAPINVPHLRPGSIWNLDIHDAGYGQLLQRGRLRRVSVSVSITDGAVVEKISPSIYPVGYEEGSL